MDTPRNPFPTVDAIIDTPSGYVFVKRKNPPHGLALPGGFVEYGESVEDAIRREVLEETGLVLTDLRQFHVYSDPKRDPRWHALSVVFTAKSKGTPKAGDDAADIVLMNPRDFYKTEFAFDHKQILLDWLLYIAQIRRHNEETMGQ